MCWRGMRACYKCEKGMTCKRSVCVCVCVCVCERERERERERGVCVCVCLSANYQKCSAGRTCHSDTNLVF